MKTICWQFDFGSNSKSSLPISQSASPSPSRSRRTSLIFPCNADLTSLYMLGKNRAAFIEGANFLPPSFVFKSQSWWTSVSALVSDAVLESPQKPSGEKLTRQNPQINSLKVKPQDSLGRFSGKCVLYRKLVSYIGCLAFVMNSEMFWLITHDFWPIRRASLLSGLPLLIHDRDAPPASFQQVKSAIGTPPVFQPLKRSVQDFSIFCLFTCVHL